MSERKEQDRHLDLASEMGEKMAMEAYADLLTLFMQDIEAWKVAKAHGLDVKDSFRVCLTTMYSLLVTKGSNMQKSVS